MILAFHQPSSIDSPSWRLAADEVANRKQADDTGSHQLASPLCLARVRRLVGSSARDAEPPAGECRCRRSTTRVLFDDNCGRIMAPVHAACLQCHCSPGPMELRPVSRVGRDDYPSKHSGDSPQSHWTLAASHSRRLRWSASPHPKTARWPAQLRQQESAAGQLRPHEQFQSVGSLPWSLSCHQSHSQ